MSQFNHCFVSFTDKSSNSLASVISFAMLFFFYFASSCLSPDLATAAGALLFPSTQDDAQSSSQLHESKIFVSGTDDYDTYRIPSLIVAQNGDLLAFCEARRESRSDTGDIDLILRRSVDGGKSWSASSTVWDDGNNTCGNPCPVVDRSTGKIYLLMTWNAGNVHESKVKAGFGRDSRLVFVSESSDHGKSWTSPVDISRSTKENTWSWYATGPGAGIQIEHGEFAGRLVIPCDHKVPGEEGTTFNSHVIFSDDHGTSWQTGGSATSNKVNECEVVELEEGRLMLNMRNYDRLQKARQISFSEDGGTNWVIQRHDEALIEPICQASIRRFRWKSDGQPGVILFSNPANTTERKNMTVRASYDDGRTWKDSRVIHEGGSAYSCLAVLQDGTIGCLYEKDGYKNITLARFPLSWVTGE